MGRSFAVAMVLWALPASPAVGQQVQVFFGNLHSHTSYSDGQQTPEQAYRHARDVAGLDFLAVTEHNHAGARSKFASDPALYNGDDAASLVATAERFTEDGRFVALYGQEFSSIKTGNHANVLDVRDVITSDDVPNGEWDDLLDAWIPQHPDSSGREALILLNHPATSKSSNAVEYGRDDYNTLEAWRGALDARAQLINIINGPSHHGTEPAKPSESEFQRYLNLGFHVGPTADQDNHRSDWGDAADTRTGVLAARLTKADLMEALRRRRVYATQDSNLALVCRINGQLMGTRMGGASLPAPGGAVAIELRIDDADEPLSEYTVDVFQDVIGGNEEADIAVSTTVTGNGTHVIEGVTYPGGNVYVYLRVTQEHDDVVEGDRAWLAPVWLEPGAPDPPDVPLLVGLQVDLQAETAEVTNLGSETLDTGGWRLVSRSGNQVFSFPAIDLPPGGMVTVTSGPAAREAFPSFLRWTGSSVWRNAGDPAELLDASGSVLATDP